MVTPLKKPIRRRLEATDRKGRPFVVTLYPSGAIELAPRRLKPEHASIEQVYQSAVIARVRAERAAKKPPRRVLAKRGML